MTLNIAIIVTWDLNIITDRRMAENGFAPPPPLANFADISYLVEN